MFGLADLIVIEGINRGLANLRANPSHFEFILSYLESVDGLKNFGKDYVKNCVDFINNNKLLVKPYLSPDLNQVPSFVVGATYNEVAQYLGQYGTEFTKQQTPKIYATFDVESYEDNWVYLDPLQKIEENVWPRMVVSACPFSATIKSIMIRNGNTTILELDRPVPEGTDFKGWTAQLYSEDRIFTCSTSMERATVQCKLTTSGDIATHRVMCTVIRYCFKYSRLYMDSVGLQNTVISQGLPVVSDDEAPIFETMFSLEGDEHDFWIDHESTVPALIGLESIAISDNPDDAKVDV
jgi:hypothetical protein